MTTHGEIRLHDLSVPVSQKDITEPEVFDKTHDSLSDGARPITGGRGAEIAPINALKLCAVYCGRFSVVE